MSRLPRLVGFAATLFLAACDSSSGDQDALIISSDPDLRSAAEELLPDLTARAGLELQGPVRLERRTREQLVRYLTAKLDEDLPPQLADRLTRSYALLGLVPADLDLRALLLSVYTEQVAGFYDPDSTALFVLDDQPVEELGAVLIHELVHAVQDQSVDLEALTAPERGNDRQSAAQAAIEGHATLVMMEYLMERMQGAPVDLAELEGFGTQLREALGSVRAQFPALGGAPRIVQEALLFPYLEGAGFVQSVWRDAPGRPAPFGEYLPESTEQVLRPERLVGDPRDDPREIDLTISGARVVHSDVLGELEIRVMLEELSGQPAPEGPLGWHGDRFMLLETPSGDALVWVAVFDETAGRDDFQQRLLPLIDRLPRPATLEATDVGGRPAVVLRIGESGDVTATLGPSPRTAPSEGVAP